MGLMVVGSILGCLFLGLWIDGKLYTKPLATLIFIAVGTLVAIVGTYRLARSFIEQQLEEGKKESS
ncbi:MAG: AtpZ/AtpI family protein [Dehalococcoidia bacterium]|nr:AtpZ/AtpI family protein [Dehalococcoidia bacterium]